MTGLSIDDPQWPTLAAVAVGVVGALALVFLWRWARGVLAIALLGMVICFVWIRASR